MLHAESVNALHFHPRNPDRILHKIQRGNLYVVADCPPDDDGTIAFRPGASFGSHDVFHGLAAGYWPDGLVFVNGQSRFVVRSGELIDTAGTLAVVNRCAYKREPCNAPRHKTSKYCKTHMLAMARHSHSKARVCADCQVGEPVWHSTLCATCAETHHKAKLARNAELKRQKRQAGLCR